jgi:hypothetical protein
VADVKIPYYRTKGGTRPGTRRMGYWAPCLARPNKETGEFEPTLMAKLGFKHVECGEDGPRAWAIAQSWNEKWKAARAAYLAGQPVEAISRGRVYPPNSLGEAFGKFRTTATWKGKKPRTREDWERGWKLIEPVFGDVDPRTVGLEEVDLWYGGDPDDATIKGLLQTVSVREAHRAMKIWRALWKVIATIKRADGERYCEKTADPSLGIRRKTPQARQAIFFEGEAVRLVKRAIRMKYYGLAAALAVAWDSMLSPIDVVSLTMAKLHRDDQGPLFSVERTKTGEAAIGTLSARTTRLLEDYLATLPKDYLPQAPIFLTRGGGPVSRPGKKGEWGGNHGGGRPRPPAVYTVNKLGQDFRKVRAIELPGDRRAVIDFRRSGAVEHEAGRGDRKMLAKKMANTIDKSAALQETYLPPVLPPDRSVVQLADEARARGRARLRGSKGGNKS